MYHCSNIIGIKHTQNKDIWKGWEKCESSCKLPGYIQHRETICLCRDLRVDSFLIVIIMYPSSSYVWYLSNLKECNQGPEVNFYVHD